MKSTISGWYAMEEGGERIVSAGKAAEDVLVLISVQDNGPMKLKARQST